MNWSKLKDFCCPKTNCGDQLKHEKNQKIYSCGCGFVITEERFEEIVTDMHSVRISKGDDTDAN